MQSLVDFLSFKLFISSYVLIVCYYIGALGVPIVSWLLARWVKGKFSLPANAYKVGKQEISQVIPPRSRLLLISIFILFFICLEIIWRMLFEFLIAYFQIRDALMELTLH